jgi:hypothetical protein
MVVGQTRESEDAMVVLADRVETLGIETRPMLIELSGVRKIYRTGKLEYPALRGVDLGIEDGDMVAMSGRPGAVSRRS